MDKTRDKFLKQKTSIFCILDGRLYWKEPGGVLLNYVNEQEEKNMIEEFNGGGCGGHHYWKDNVKNITREGFLLDHYIF